MQAQKCRAGFAKLQISPLTPKGVSPNPRYINTLALVNKTYYYNCYRVGPQDQTPEMEKN